MSAYYWSLFSRTDPGLGLFDNTGVHPFLIWVIYETVTIGTYAQMHNAVVCTVVSKNVSPNV